MAHYIQRTTTVTVIETLTLIWVHPTHHMVTSADTSGAATPTRVHRYSVRRVSASAVTTILPILAAAADERAPPLGW
jgi:hypothetical protein